MLAFVESKSAVHEDVHTLIIKSGLYCPTPAMPMPDLAVPYAAPTPILELGDRRDMV